MAKTLKINDGTNATKIMIRRHDNVEDLRIELGLRIAYDVVHHDKRLAQRGHLEPDAEKSGESPYKFT